MPLPSGPALVDRLRPHADRKEESRRRAEHSAAGPKSPARSLLTKAGPKTAGGTTPDPGRLVGRYRIEDAGHIPYTVI